MNRSQAEHLLKTALNDSEASFREGQWEAIDALVNQRQRLLVVQRTGWGKSSVYFISSKILRDRGMGPTIIVSPLLALMRNQIESAQRLGIKAETMNSTNASDWQTVKQRLLQNEIDCLLISPERLANEDFVEAVLEPIADRISLMVIDEAHCISDWGHDFRPDYRRIINILRQLPPNTPVLGTTATANNRVVADIQAQLGSVNIQRGPLTRDSLFLKSMIVPDQPSRLAWLATVIPRLQGTGIIYALTIRDAEQVAEWLRQNNINAQAYHSNVFDNDFASPNEYRQYLEQQLLHNDLKVLVATTALGMGYDKPDLGFVIHYQAPSSIVAYYQQVGRAGRGIETAIGVLMYGSEDNEIHNFFRQSAFPTETQVHEILDVLAGSESMSIRGIEEHTNLRRGQIEKVLKLLSVESPAPVIKVRSEWKRTPNPFTLDRARIEHLTLQREQEWAEVQEYLSTDSCKMSFLRGALDDNNIEPCGKCESCLEEELIPCDIDPALIHQAARFLKQAEIIITPRKQVAQSNADTERSFPTYRFPRLLGDLAAEEGRALSRWLDAGWGQLVEDCKNSDYFVDELVEATAEMIEQRWTPTPQPAWVCCVPSLNQVELVPNFADRLAQRLGIPFYDIVQKVEITEPQKNQRNSFHQCINLDGAFEISQPIPEGPVLLVDDIINSGWTFTIIAALLRRAGSGSVYPLALASTSVKD